MTIPGARGEVAAAVAGLGPASEAAPSLWDGAACAERLPAGRYALARELPAPAATQFALGWLLGCYRFGRYRSQPKPAHAAGLVVPAGCDLKYAQAAAVAIGWSRDLVNTPANEFGPAELAAAAAGLAREFGGQCTLTEGEALRAAYPLVHAVGQGSARAPCLIDCRWRARSGESDAGGRGVCFDSGGLDLKPSAGMLMEGHGRRRLCWVWRLCAAMQAPVHYG
jgi:leucyl aminopeptidase